MREKALRSFRWLSVAGTVIVAVSSCPCQARGEAACRVVRRENRVELCSPFFVFRLDTSVGLRAESWVNGLTGRKISLGNGPELEFDLGLPDQPLQTPRLQVSRSAVKGQGNSCEVTFQLVAKEPALSATVTYRWNANLPLLWKLVEITNTGEREWNRLLNVRLGTYHTDAKIADNEQGFPAYLNDEFFMSLAHPAGWATGKSGELGVRQYPGIRLAPGEKFQCMQALYGVAQAGQAHRQFVAYIQSHMRRVIRGHDKPYAIFEPFGARPDGDYNESEEFLLDNVAKVAEGQREAGCHFDFYSVDFWVDVQGDIKRFNPQRFPRGLTKIRAELEKLGTVPGLWIDSGGLPAWTIGSNPAIRGCFTKGEGQGEISAPASRSTRCTRKAFSTIFARIRYGC